MLRDTDLVSIQEVRAKVEKAYAAFQEYRRFTQERVDRVVEAMAAAGRAHAQRLAEMAVEETGYGNVPDKVAKNLLNADLLPRSMRGLKTIGVLREIPDQRVVEIGVPLGVVAAILPTTNPTSTVIYKTLISLKCGNTIVLSPHPRARKCTCETASLLYQAARDAGAPEDVIQCINNATMEGTDALMRHPRTAVILATGGAGMVRAAYSSGKPAFGVGPGNVPVLLERSADVAEAVAKVVVGKAFDYGTVCSSEQSLVITPEMKDQVLAEFRKNKAYLCDARQAQALAKLLITPNWRINPNCVGQAPTKIAQMAGFSVPPETSILVTEIAGVGKEHPLSMEKLSPVLSLLTVPDWDAQIAACQAILKFGGLGHTCVIFSRDDARIREFAMRMPAFRVLVNTPSPQGSTGVTTSLQPSMTLGCGAMGGNVTSDNVGPQHLFNTKRLAYPVRTAEEAFGSSPVSAATASPAPAPPPGDLAQLVSSAVDRYLAQRGLGHAPASPPPPRAEVRAAQLASPAPSTAALVDRFLQSRGGAAPQPAAPAASLCQCAHNPAPPAPPEAAPAPAPAPAPEPAPSVADFVCEADVRTALAQKKKIFVGPRTIVTPSARELANQYDLLVMAQR